jgi:hypothetical protein
MDRGLFYRPIHSVKAALQKRRRRSYVSGFLAQRPVHRTKDKV